MAILEFIVYGAGIILAIIWSIGIRTYMRRGHGITINTVNIVMLFIAALICVYAFELSPFHLFWMYPISVLFGILSFVFPFSLLSILGSFFFKVICIGMGSNKRYIAISVGILDWIITIIIFWFFGNNIVTWVVGGFLLFWGWTWIKTGIYGSERLLTEMCSTNEQLSEEAEKEMESIYK